MIFITENEYFQYNNKTKSGKWITELRFWYEDISNIDFKTDWRFCEVKNKRKQSLLMGTVNNIVFPVEYPLRLDNGKCLDGYDPLIYNDND